MTHRYESSKVMQLSTQLFARSAILIAVQVSMTVAAQGDQVLLGIISGLAAELFVVNFEIRHRAAHVTVFVGRSPEQSAAGTAWEATTTAGSPKQSNTFAAMIHVARNLALESSSRRSIPKYADGAY